jgi:RNA polymerase sigma factor (sigma-70 family)
MTKVVGNVIPSSSAGYRDVYDIHYARLVRLAVLLGVPRGEVEDVVADCFVRTFPHWAAGSVDNVGGYLTSSVTNAVRDRARRWGVRFESLSDDLASTENLEHDATANARLTWCLERLGHLQREVVVLRFYDGLGEAETARVLGVAVGTVKSRLSRAIAALRVLMEGDLDA